LLQKGMSSAVKSGRPWRAHLLAQFPSGTGGNGGGGGSDQGGGGGCGLGGGGA